MKTNKRGGAVRRVFAALAGLTLLCSQPASAPFAGAAVQRQQRGADGARVRGVEVGGGVVEGVVAAVCAARARDPQGSDPIDKMAVRPPLPLNDSDAAAGRKRAERMLPLARKLVPAALSRLAADYNLRSPDRDWITERVNAVRTIRVDVESHDNALWRPSEPRSIIFGTVFLAGLRSDEAVLAVLAHELTHAIDGTDEALQPLVMRIAARASQLRMSQVRGVTATELACELVGLGVMREYRPQKSNARAAGERLARALGKDCVDLDLADDTHLSPLDTMRLLLTLEPDLAEAILEAEKGRAHGVKSSRSASRESSHRFGRDNY